MAQTILMDNSADGKRLAECFIGYGENSVLNSKQNKQLFTVHCVTITLKRHFEFITALLAKRSVLAAEGITVLF